MKNLIFPFTLSTLCLMMTACGGGSNVIHEDPVKKPQDTTATGCTISDTNESCFQFVMEYPIAGIQYTCSSDKVNVFRTQLDKNVVTGGCDKKDTVTFFLNTQDKARIELGSVKIPDLGMVSSPSSPVHLSVVDMAKGLTEKAAVDLDENDATIQMAMRLVKIFQAIGSQKSDDNVVGDIQPIDLDEKILDGITEIKTSINTTEYQNGQYVALLSPWVDVNKISDAEAYAVLKKALYTSAGAIYQADPPFLVQVIQGMVGSSGSEANKKELMGTFFVMSDRQGFSHGSGIQWRGIPTRESETSAGTIDLILKTPPIMMYAKSQSNLINPVNKKIASNEKFLFKTSKDDDLYITSGRLINDYAVAGTDSFYKFLTNIEKAPSNDLAKWDMRAGGDSYQGTVDFVKAYPISYLDRRVFKSKSNMETGDKYYFPLFATLTFNYDEKNINPIKLGIVIDEHGDIRTDVKDWSNKTDLTGQCAELVDPSQALPKDNFGVQQYRIGTIGATNYQPQQSDMSVSPRIILSGQHFADLDGTLVGVDNTVLGADGTAAVNSNGAKINLHSLLTATGTNAGTINISNYGGGVASWVNVYNQWNAIYIKNDKTATDAQKDDISKRITGAVSIQLASCYQPAKIK